MLAPLGRLLDSLLALPSNPPDHFGTRLECPKHLPDGFAFGPPHIELALDRPEPVPNCFWFLVDDLARSFAHRQILWALPSPSLDLSARRLPQRPTAKIGSLSCSSFTSFLVEGFKRGRSSVTPGTPIRCPPLALSPGLTTSPTAMCVPIEAISRTDRSEPTDKIRRSVFSNV